VRSTDNGAMAPVVLPIFIAVVAAVAVLVFAGRMILRETPERISELRHRPEAGESRVGLLASTRQELNEAADAHAGIDEMLGWSELGPSYLEPPQRVVPGSSDAEK
jgi:hypothetical protein